MKVLPTARILIIDPQAERREALRQALMAFGVGGVQEASSLDELAASPGSVAQHDVLVVHAENAEQVPENPHREGIGAPAILVTEGSAQILMRAAARGGYDAALAAPVAPRLLYRRIGSVMQRARRVERSGAAVIPAADEQVSAQSAQPSP